MHNSEEIISQLKQSTDLDAMALVAMAEAGSDLSKPHSPEFSFQTDFKAVAEAIENELSNLGYGIVIYEPDDEAPYFEIEASCVMVLELEKLKNISAAFKALAAKYRASYDGWGAEVVE
ncbi:MAG: ribonuclease E inhibitor RraB [bacterium]|nr:ribonuclease E inhibitor RraB [bacterium]